MPTINNIKMAVVRTSEVGATLTAGPRNFVW